MYTYKNKQNMDAHTNRETQKYPHAHIPIHIHIHKFIKNTNGCT